MNKKGKYILISEDSEDLYRDEKDNIIFIDDYNDACCMIGMIEADGYVCEIKYHHKENVKND